MASLSWVRAAINTLSAAQALAEQTRKADLALIEQSRKMDQNWLFFCRRRKAASPHTR